MANPIKTSDILQDDNLDALIAKIKQLESVVESLTAALKKQESEASELEATTKTLNGTTAQGREQIVKNAKAADDVEKAYKNYQKAISETNTQIQHYRTEANIANQIKKAEAKLAANVEGSYNALSAQYSLIKIRLNAMSKAEREATEEGKALVKRSKEIHDEMKRLQAETGNTALNVGNYTESIKDALGEMDLFSGQLSFITTLQKNYTAATKAFSAAQAGMAAATGGSSNALKVFRLALISTGIGAIVVVLGTLIAAFLSTQEGIDALNRVLVPLKTVFEGLWGAIQKLAIQGFGALKKAIQDPIGTLKEFGNTIQEYLIGKLEAFGQLGKALGRILSGEIKEGFKDLGAAAKDLSVINDVAEAFGKVAGKTGKVIKENWKLGQSINALRVQLREEEIAFESRKAALERQVAAGRELASDQEKSTAQREAGLNSALSALNKLQKEEESIAKKRLQLAKLEASASDTDAEGRREIQRLEGELIRTETDNLNKRKELVRQLSGIRKQAAAAAAAATKAEQDARLKDLESQTKYNLAKFDNETEYGNLSEDYQRARQIERFNIEQEGNRVVLEEQRRFNRISIQEYETALLEMSAKQREFAAKIRAEREKDNPSVLPGFDFGKRSQALAEKRVQDISKELAKKAKEALKEEERSGNIYDLLGINITDEGKEQVKSALDFAKQQLSDFLAFRTKIADRNVANADREVAAAQSALDQAMQDRRDGLADMVETRRKDLADAQQKQREAIKAQEQAQRAQQRIQTVEQAVNLITAVSKVFSTVPFPLNIGAVAVMLGAFASAKIQAAQLSRREFAEGDFTILEGGSHASGNDIFVGQGKDGRPEYAEGGEARMILSRKSTRKYRSLLPEIFHALKAGTFEQEFTRQANAARELPLIVNTGGGQLVNMRGVEKGIGHLIEQGKDRQYTDSKGRLVVKRGNLTTVYVN